MNISKAVFVRRDGIIDTWDILKSEIPEIKEIWDKEGKPKVRIVKFKK